MIIMAKSKIVAANKKIEKSVVGIYNKIESGVVGGFNKISDKFVDNYLTREGESVEEAKERLSMERKSRMEKQNR
jgi:predicted RecB family nuclease